MITERKPTKATIEKIDLANNQVRLGIDFMATLDKKTYFPKHISLLARVVDQKMFGQLAKQKLGTEILAKIRSDSVKDVDYLENFELLD